MKKLSENKINDHVQDILSGYKAIADVVPGVWGEKTTVDDLTDIVASASEKVEICSRVNAEVIDEV